jgi:cytochrome c
MMTQRGIITRLTTLALGVALFGATSLSAADGATLYKKCASCHGSQAEKPALGKSQVIQGWESAKIVAALNGYKDGSYGGAMKGLMKGQVAPLNEAQIKLLGDYIHGLK